LDDMRIRHVQRIVFSVSIPSKNAISLHFRGRPVLPALCIRWQSTASKSSPVPPPQPTETTSKSSGLNPQLHPTGRPPITLKPTQSNTVLRESSPPPETGNGEKGAFRTPLRTQRTDIPVSVKDSVKVVYEGPLRTTVRGLKAFSVSSLLFSAGVTPWILTMEAPVPMIARVSMVSAGTPHLPFRAF
jgi:hypothetical protein